MRFGTRKGEDGCHLSSVVPSRRVKPNLLILMPSNLNHVFGRAVKSARSALGISQEELAGRAGLHRTYISDLERGARNPSLKSIEKLAEALELSVAGLFRRVNEGGNPERAVEILLVEGGPCDVLTMQAFRRAHFTNPVHVVSDGEAAFDFIFADDSYADWGSETRPGLVLLDLLLPKVLDGLEVLRRIRSHKRTRKIPVVVLIGSRNRADMAECTRLGVSHYIGKPVDFKQFSEVVSLMQFQWSLVRPN